MIEICYNSFSNRYREDYDMTRVMFVCHGNICRSPMAEFIFKDMVKKAGIADSFVISSAATSTEEIWNGIGSPIYPPAREELRRHGIAFTERRATLLRPDDLDEYDLFIGMDNANIRNMHRILGMAGAEKIRRMMDFTSRPGEVSDPWYSDRFDEAYRDIYEGCRGLLQYLLKQ